MSANFSKMLTSLPKSCKQNSVKFPTNKINFLSETTETDCSS